MQKFTVILFLMLISLSSLFAQPHNKREKLKAYKTAYITQKLDLTPSEAEKFWPVYNAYEKKVFQLKVAKGNVVRTKIKEKGGLEALTEKEANQILAKITQNEQATIDAKKELFRDLKSVIPSKKILKLNQAEHQFNRKLLSDYRKNKPMDMNR